MICGSKNKSYLKSQNLKIFGQGKLNGIVEISGAKNSALVLLAASLLTNEKIVLQNVPRLTDIEKMANILRNLGVKFGRYHIFLFKLFKPSVVSLRILLWKNFKGEDLNLFPPTFGLNFVNDLKYRNKKFMLLCGFEKFDRFYVRIDILERLFLMIFNSKNKNNDTEIKLIPDMLNLLGCNKENFIKLLNKMNYKTFEKEKDLYFKYLPSKKVFKKKNVNKEIKDNPFQVLKQLNLD